jgi:hypothetical protein
MHGCGSAVAAIGTGGVASARGFAADAIGPYDGSNYDDPSASFEKLLR